MKKWCLRLVCAVFGMMVFLAPGMALAAMSLPTMFSDHMVVQQGVKAPIWGKADPGEAIQITVGKKNIKTVADAQGNWKTHLPKMKLGGPYTITVHGKTETVKIEDVLAGEVWVCSGQSNMEWVVKNSMNAEQEMAQANLPSIRQFLVKKNVSGEPLGTCEGSWVVCSPQTVGDFTAVGYFFGRTLHNELKRPVGLINSSWGGTPAEAWISKESIASSDETKMLIDFWNQKLQEYPAAKAKFDEELAAWEAEADKAEKAGKEAPGGKPREPWGPKSSWLVSGLYGGMIAPIVPYAIKGAIWYQGESNAGRAYQYRTLMPMLIQDWRKQWGYSFPFYLVQLANFKDQEPEPGDNEWAELREAQNMTMSLEKTGKAVIIDIGEAKDIHPRNKQMVGYRLALNALVKDYGYCCAPYSGPEYDKMEIKGNEIEISFTHTKGGLKTRNDEPVKGFAIAGEDKKFVWAKAVIKGDKVVVSAPGIAKPVAVRYAWAINPDCNLYNGAKLPASPFRTDDWPGITVGNKTP